MPGRKKSPDYRALDLSEKSSHSAASIDRVPASHCCQLRCVRCTKAEAAAVESPASSRACRISEGVGLFVGIRQGKNNFSVGAIFISRVFSLRLQNSLANYFNRGGWCKNFKPWLGACCRQFFFIAHRGINYIGRYFSDLLIKRRTFGFPHVAHDLLRLSDSVGLEVISRTVTVDKVIFAMRFIGFYQLTEGLIPSILIAMNKSILLSYKLVQMMTFLTVFSVLSGLHDLLRLVRGLIRSTHEQSIANNVRAHKSYFASNENNFARAA